MDYFMSASFKHYGGHLKSLSEDYFSYNNNVRNFNYDFINNLNVYLTSTTKISLGLNLSVADKKSPVANVDNIFQSALKANPVDFPYFSRLTTLTVTSYFGETNKEVPKDKVGTEILLPTMLPDIKAIVKQPLRLISS